MQFGALPAGARATWFLMSIYDCQNDVLFYFALQMIIHFVICSLFVGSTYVTIYEITITNMYC